MRKYALTILGFVLAVASFSQNGEGKAASKLNDSKMQWWKDAKFGMFIHWGLYSVPAGKWDNNTNHGEWIMLTAKIPRATYSALSKEFNPTQFNAEEWVKLAKAAGQKYMVLGIQCMG